MHLTNRDLVLLMHSIGVDVSMEVVGVVIKILQICLILFMGFNKSGFNACSILVFGLCLLIYEI